MTIGTKIMMILFLIISFSLGLVNVAVIFLSDNHNIGASIFVAISSFFLCGEINNEILINEESKEYE